MKDDLSEAMRRTLLAVRSGDLSGATRIVKESLGNPMPASGAFPDPAASARDITPHAKDIGAPPMRETSPQGGRPDPAPQGRRPDPAAGPGHAAPPRGENGQIPPQQEPAGGESVLQSLFGRLRDGLSGLADCGMPGTSRQGEEIVVPPGAQWLARRHDGPAGSRDYRLFIPSRGAEQATGLLLMLHGCKQNPEDFALGTGMLGVAEAEGLILAFPAQPRIANMSGCWNWFEPGHQTAAAGEPAILTGLVRSLAAEFHVPEGRIFAAGLSAGGAMVAVLADADPELFAAIGIHSGLAAGAAHDVASAFAAMGGTGAAGRPALRRGGPRLIVFHGDADGTVAVTNADRLFDTAPRDGTAGVTPAGRRYLRRRITGPDGSIRAEDWRIEGGGHAWSGGSAAGSYTDPAGPDASAEMVRFFLGRD